MHVPACIAVLLPAPDFIYHTKKQLLPQIGKAV